MVLYGFTKIGGFKAKKSSIMVKCLRLSHDSTLLALGSDNGTLEIRKSFDNFQTPVYTYSTGAPIRTMLWDTLSKNTVLIGATNGFIHAITVDASGSDERPVRNHASLDNYIHAMAMGPGGKYLAVAHGKKLTLFVEPFKERNDLGVGADINLPEIRGNSPEHKMIVRGIHFVNSEMIAVTFFGPHDIYLISCSTLQIIASIPLRHNTIVGSSALSPTGMLLAVMNMVDGVDFYSINSRKCIATVKYPLCINKTSQNRLVDIVFINEDTALVGHVNGLIRLVTCDQTNTVSSDLVLTPSNSNRCMIQTLDFGIMNRVPIIVAATSIITSQSPERDTLEIDLLTFPLQWAYRSKFKLSFAPLQSLGRYKLLFLLMIPALLLKAGWTSGPDLSHDVLCLTMPPNPTLPTHVAATTVTATSTSTVIITSTHTAEPTVQLSTLSICTVTTTVKAIQTWATTQTSTLTTDIVPAHTKFPDHEGTRSLNYEHIKWQSSDHDKIACICTLTAIFASIVHDHDRSYPSTHGLQAHYNVVV